MDPIVSQIARLTIVYSAVYSGADKKKKKKKSKLRVTGLCAGNSPDTGEFPAQMASYAKNVSMWWRHHAYRQLLLNLYEKLAVICKTPIYRWRACSQWYLCIYPLTHWGRMRHTCICADNLIIIGSDNDLSPVRRQTIIWTNAGILLFGTLGTNFSDILIEIQTFSFKKICLKVSAKWRSFCLSLNVWNTETKTWQTNVTFSFHPIKLPKECGDTCCIVI